MRAWAIDCYGNNDVVTLREVPGVSIGPRQMRVEVHAASVNPIDFKIRDGKMRAIRRLEFPAVLGCDLSGVVREIGAEVTRFKPGDAIFARLDKKQIGSFAESCVVHELHAALKPTRLSYVEAAAVPLAALTAQQTLLGLARLSAGQSVLIHAGAGGVGTFAIQLAHLAGARVFTTASTKNHALLTELGADVAIDYRSQRFEDLARDVDVVLDSMGGETLLRSFACVKRGGWVVSIGGIPDLPTARELELGPLLKTALFAMNLGVQRRARKAGVRYRYLFMHPDGAELAQLGALCDQGKLRPIVDKVFPFERGAEAIAAVETGQSRGKVVIQVR